ncbi:MAG: hypothetical protein IJV23_02150 [Prevotella sp.]|nr:hypothetical protein [Prevotella sp.]
MKKLAIRIIWGMTCSLSFLFSACTNDDIEEMEVSLDKPVWVRALHPLSITSDEPLSVQRANRVVLIDEGVGHGMTAKWQTTDEVGIWNITAAREGQRGYDVVHPSVEDRVAEFYGDVHCAVGDELAMVYPYSCSKYLQVNNDGTLDLDLRSQNGTLSDIEKNFDLVYGKAKVLKISDEGVATAYFGKLKSAIAVFALSFTDENDSLIVINQLHIKINGGHTQAKLRLSDVGSGNELAYSGQDTLYVKPANITTNVYVAMFGNVSGKELLFDIVDKYGFSHKAKAKLKDNINTAQIIRRRMKSKPGDYIEFDGVKIATGNLIWDQGPRTGIMGNSLYSASYDFGLEHYFIAPSQAWSPEQFTDVLSGGTPRWPEASPVNGGIDNVYYSTFINTSASMHGLISARGRVPLRNSNSASAYTQSYVNATIPAEGLNYDARLFNQYNDINSWVELDDVLSGAVKGGWKDNVFYGDLAYLATRGKWRLPTRYEWSKVFKQDNNNKKWAVYRISTANRNMNYYDGSSIPGNVANVYGLLVWNENASEYINSLPTVDGGSTIVINDETLKKALFLPADGNRGFNDFIYPYNAAKPRVGCAYLTGYLRAGSMTQHTTELYQANLDEGGSGTTLVYVNYQNRIRTGSIRPVLCNQNYVFDPYFEY